MSDSRIRVAVIGGGSVGVGFIRKLQTQRDMRVTAVVTRTAARREELAGQFGIAAFGSTEELMSSPDKPLVACVVNANDAHRAATAAALAGGAHVYCEKPMAPTLAECVEMVAAERRSGRCLQVGFEYMHGSMTSRLKRLVDEGFFGEVLWASVVDSRGHWWSADPQAEASEIWKLDRRRGGGIVFHCGIHQLDMIRCYLGPIDEITAYLPPRNPLPYYPDDVPANVTLMLRTRSGAVCNFQIFHDRAPCYYREVPAFRPDWRQVPGHEFQVSLVGTAASCKMEIYQEKLHLFRFDHARKDTLLDRTEVFGPNPPDKSHHDMIGLLLRFIRSVAAGGPAIDPAADALETMRLAFAAEDAIARGGGTVSLKDYR